MTKRFSFWLLLAIGATTVVFNSCGNDEPEPPKPPQEIAVTGISLNKAVLTLAIGESETLVAIIAPDDATDKTVIWESNNPSIVTVDAEGNVTALAEGTVTIIAKAGKKTAECVVTVINPLTHDEGVEINGVVWATRNVDVPGTFAEKSEDAGMFYLWNRKIGWSSSNPLVNSNGDTEWYNTPSQATEWEKVNDPCPQGWRVPTKDEFVTLGNSGSEWTTVNGVVGRQFGATPNTIFLPAAGWRFNVTGALSGVETWGSYWSSTAGNMPSAWFLHFTISSVSAGDYTLNRAYGMSVRCVAE